MNRRFDWKLPAFAAVFILFVFCWWHWAGWQHRAWIAAGFGARVACSCRQVEGRPLDSCRRDFAHLDGMGLVNLSDRADGKGVNASVPMLAHRSARVVPGFGCIVEP